MDNYYNSVSQEIKDYFAILEPNFPKWLNKYIDTKELLAQQYISMSCGKIYTNLFKSDFFYSSLDHSIGVALIIWHFTHDKIQTLAGLFHDIATPAFKHCIDFLNGDYIKQESTEDLTTTIIKNSPEIMNLLNSDNIKVEQIDNYHLYPIADNDTPQLSADRLEYSLSNAFLTYKLLDKDSIKEIYNDLEIQINENKEGELGFKTKKSARNFVKVTSMLSITYRDDETRYSMQFIANIIKRLINEGLMTKNDLYSLKESEIILIIENSKYKDIFKIWRMAKKVKVSKEKPDNVYYVHLKSKVRYIDPLVNGTRISKCCKIAERMIKKNLSYKMDNYIYLDFKMD